MSEFGAGGPGDPGMGEGPTEEQLAAFEEQLKRIRVEDVLVQTAVTLVNLGARRLGLTGEPEARDLDQARLAIEGARALLPLVPIEGLEPVRDALSQLQMAYVQAAGGAPQAPGQGEEAAPAPEAGAEQAAAPDPGPQPDASSADTEAERQKARAKIWTPPGS
jgi:hypothetical protein